MQRPANREAVSRIAEKFLERASGLEGSGPDRFLFDTTDCYTPMAGGSPSKLAKRGGNKEGGDWLRQIGVALLVARDTRLPFFHGEYEGNRQENQRVELFLRQAAGTRASQGGSEVLRKKKFLEPGKDESPE